jgi:hypothetical protein
MAVGSNIVATSTREHSVGLQSPHGESDIDLPHGCDQLNEIACEPTVAATCPLAAEDRVASDLELVSMTERANEVELWQRAVRVSGHI